MAKLWICVALSCLAVAAATEGLLKRGNKEERLFFGSYRTITNTGVTLTTSTVYASCVSGSLTTVCTGKRKKRAVNSLQIDEPDHEIDTVDSSIEEPEDPSSGRTPNPTGKLSGIYTIWTTATTSTTVTTRYTDTATTVSLSIYCSAGSIDYPPVFCG